MIRAKSVWFKNQGPIWCWLGRSTKFLGQRKQEFRFRAPGSEDNVVIRKSLSFETGLPESEPKAITGVPVI